IAFVTGTLDVNDNRTLRGYGILVVRDDFHPDEGGSNEPSTDAHIRIQGKLEWTGLVILAGWHPNLDLQPQSGSATGQIIINGALFGEDSVQSGGETALDTAQIQAYLGRSISNTSTSTSERGKFQ